jgi:hypothetical protein
MLLDRSIPVGQQVSISLNALISPNDGVQAMSYRTWKIRSILFASRK